MLWRAWNDSVWSKVIAAGIIAALATLGAFTVKHMEGVFQRSAALLTRDVLVPAWLMLGTGIVLMVLIATVIVLWQRRKPRVQDTPEAEPNAVLVALVPPKRT